MSDVFISYKAEDRRRIQPLVQALQADGYSVWWDEHIGTGDEWRQTIEKQLDGARCVIVIWSKGSVGPEGHFVRDEASRALRRHVYVPVLIDAVDPPLGFGESQATSLRGWKGDRSDGRYQAVLAAVKRTAGDGSGAATWEPKKGAAIKRRAVIGGGAAAVLAVAGAGAWTLLKRGSAGTAPSVAVLPFANLSGDPGQAYFSDGIAEELRTVLARIPRLKVIGRTSSELVRSADAVTAARRLEVAHIIMGSVRRSPSMVRVSAQLVSGRDGVEQWSQVYDRAPGDILMMQSDIAKSIADALQLQLGGAGERALVAGGTTSASAHDLYLQADAVGQSGLTEENLRESIRLFDRAIAADDEFADAYAQKAVALSTLTGVFANTAADFDRGYTEAAAIARRAIALAPNRALGHSALAVALGGILDVPGALAEHQRARRLFAGEPDVLANYSLFMSKVGKAQEGLRAANQAIPIDPLNPGSYAMRTSALWFGHRFSDAAASSRELIRIAHEAGPMAFINLGNSLMLLGRNDEARDVFSKAPADNVYRMTSESILQARTGNPVAATNGLGRLRDKYGDSAAYQQAQILAQMKQADGAVAALERSWQVRDPGLLSMAADPFVDPVRNDPRFVAIHKRMKFPS
jgi:TolB-like protein